MRAIVFIILISTLVLFSCKNSSQAMGADRIEPANSGKNLPKDKVQDEVVYDMIISFISKGEGIDHNLKSKIDEKLKSFNQKNDVKLKPEIVGWGREGEVDYNFIGKNLSTKQKKELATQVKAAIGSSDMVHVVFMKKSVHKR